MDLNKIAIIIKMSEKEAQEAGSDGTHPASNGKRTIDLSNVSFSVDPMVEHKMQMQMQDNARFAQTIHTNITKMFYEYIIFKVKMRENLNLAIKGETRSGKSTVALSLGNFISGMTRVPYTAYNICANESEYYSKVKNAKFNEMFHIDEQKESKFGAGSFREEMGIMDIQNIIAKQCVHTIWIYPSDFIARNSVYGLETYGKDLTNKLIRCLVYDVRKSMMGLATPLGYIIVPKLQDSAYQKEPENSWSKYRLKNKYELKRGDFDSKLEEEYEVKKDIWIGKEQTRDMGFHHEERFKCGVWLGEQAQFQEQTSKAKQKILARQVFRDLTEQEIDEIVEIARMGIKEADIDKIRKKQIKDGKVTREQSEKLEANRP